MQTKYVDINSIDGIEPEGAPEVDVEPQTETERPIPPIGPGDKAAQIVASAQALVGTMTGLAEAMGGPAWQARTAERQAMEDSLTGWMLTRDMIDLPPGIVVAITFSAYAIASFQRMPEDRQDNQPGKKDIGGFFKRWALRRELKKEESRRKVVDNVQENEAKPADY